MKNTLLAGLLCISLGTLSACSGSYLELRKLSASDSIVGGTTLEKADVDSKKVVLVRGSKENSEYIEYTICTGAFITPDIVLTAAHCFDDDSFTYDIVYSTNLSGINDKSDIAKIDKVKIHQDYLNKEKKPHLLSADIALVKIKGQIRYDYLVQSLATSEELKSLTTKQNALAIGYGITRGDRNNRENDSGILRKTSIRLNLSDSSVYNYHVVDQSNSQGICQGDSGGPGFVVVNGQLKIFGIAKGVFVQNGNVKKLAESDPSFDICRHQAYYLSTSFYQDWIQKTIDDLRQSDIVIRKSIL